MWMPLFPLSMLKDQVSLFLMILVGTGEIVDVTAAVGVGVVLWYRSKVTGAMPVVEVW